MSSFGTSVVLRRHFHSASRTLAQNLKPTISAEGLASPLDTYVARHTTPPQPIQALRSLRAKTLAEFPDAHKATSPEQGTFLSTLVRATGAMRVLEVGSFTGLATLTLAFAVANNKNDVRREGKVIACETDTKAVEIAKLWTKNCGLDEVVEIRIGPALETIQQLDPRQKFDMIFIDANKGGYIDYFNTIMERDLLSEDGLIIADNTLYRGLVHDPSLEADFQKKEQGSEEASCNRITAGHLRTAKKMRQFNKHVCADSRVVVSVLPLFDGLTVIQKLKGHNIGRDWSSSIEGEEKRNKK